MRSVVVFGLLALISCSSVNADWWETMSLYQIYPRSWKDSDGDGVGDLRGIEHYLTHLADSGIDAFWMSPIYTSPMADFGYDISNFTDIDPIFGTLADFDSLVATAKSLGLKVIMDFVPNHTSDEHEWFALSAARVEPYTDFYVWHEGTISPENIRSEPNNWVSVFGGSAWTWNAVRGAYYLHQFHAKQPDLNYRNLEVIRRMNAVLEFWLDRGVDGFRVDAINFLFEAEGFPDEPLSGLTNSPIDYDYTVHNYTRDQPETYDMVTLWRLLLNNYAIRTNSETKIMMTEAYANLPETMQYYTAGAHFTFNFQLISNANGDSTPRAIFNIINQWLENLPEGSTSNWVIGNHDNSRVATRYGSDLVDAMNMLNLLLPGVSVTYAGEEIGMEDRWLSWSETVDPAGCNLDEDTYQSASRDPARTPFQWDPTISAGFSTNSTPWLPVHENYRTVNVFTQLEDDESHVKVFRALTTLRNEAVVQRGSVDVQLLNSNVLAFSRVLEGEDSVFVVINFANNAETVSLDVYSGAADNLAVFIASVNSTLTAGTIVSRNSIEIPPRAGIVLRGGANAIAASIIFTLLMSMLAQFAR